MEIFGYCQKDVAKNELLTMKEICFQISLEEIDDLILFLQYVRERHQGVSNIAYCPHTHYSGWKGDYINIKPDIIVATPFPQNKPRHISDIDMYRSE